MAEYIDNGLVAVKSGEVLPLEVTNKCDNPFSVGTGLIFNADGQYLVTVYGRKIKVEKSNKLNHGKWGNCGKGIIINIGTAAEQYKHLGYAHRVELAMRCSICSMITFVDETIRYYYCPHCGAKMDLE